MKPGDDEEFALVLVEPALPARRSRVPKADRLEGDFGEGLAGQRLGVLARLATRAGFQATRADGSLGGVHVQSLGLSVYVWTCGKVDPTWMITIRLNGDGADFPAVLADWKKLEKLMRAQHVVDGGRVR